MSLPTRRNWTIGYGHTEGVGPNSTQLTLQQASELLQRDLDAKYAPFVAALGLPLAEHQFDALVSFVFNCGGGAISEQTMIGQALRAKNWQAAADHLLDWDKANHKTVPGLTRRRKAERALFLAVDDPFSGYTDGEKRWIREYDRLLRDDTDPDRRRVLRRTMADERQKIWRAAQPKAKGGDGQGWDHAHRRARYASLLARTH